MYAGSFEYYFISLNSQFQNDIAWFNYFLYQLNGMVMIPKCSHQQIQAYIDASLSGIGVIWDDHVYAATYARNYLTGKSIVHF